MKSYRLLLGLLLLTLIGAVGAWLIRSDPGYVLIRHGPWAVETSLVFAVFAGLIVVGTLFLLLKLLRWPLEAYRARARRTARQRLARAALALVEGRPARAAQLFAAASRAPSLATTALIGRVFAERRRGAAKAAGEALAELQGREEAQAAASVLRAGDELRLGQAGTVIELLSPLDNARHLPPAGLWILVDALSVRGRAREALAQLPRLAKTACAPAAELHAHAVAIACAALVQTSDAINLDALWRDLESDLRCDPRVAAAYARRAVGVGRAEVAADELAKVARQTDSALIAATYLRLPGSALAERVAFGEAFLAREPQNDALLLALGDLCRRLQQWGKAEHYLHRGLSGGDSAAAWEGLGALFADLADHPRASRAYANAVAVREGGLPLTVTSRVLEQDLLRPAAVAEVRDDFGVPRLPGVAR